MSTMKRCQIEGCPSPHRARGFCTNHYYQERRRQRRGPRPTLAERFWAKVNKNGPDGCWQWTAGRLGSTGYGHFEKQPAHRVAYELAIGAIPPGLHIDHLCRNRICVNPDHLEPVTQRENNLRGVGPSALNAVKRVCDYGHPFNVANTYHRPDGNRDCRPCKARRERDRQRRIREGSSA